MIRTRAAAAAAARALSTSSTRTARLLNSSISVQPEFANTPPPLPPLPLATRPLPPIAPGTPTEDFDDFCVKSFACHQMQNPSLFPDLQTLREQVDANAGAVLTETLKNESAPSPSRRVVINVGQEDSYPPGTQSGVVVVAHVSVRGPDQPAHVAVSSGFVIGETIPGEGVKVLTCCHSLQSAAKRLASNSTTSTPPSASFILSSSGHLFPVTSVLSSIPSVDIMILKIAPEAVRNPSYGLRHAGATAPSSDASHKIPILQSLPISPYPAPVGTPVASLVFRNPAIRGGGDSTTRGENGPTWAYGRVTEYSDFAGRLAATGTLDDLSAMHLSTVPTQGSSGGPVVCVQTGSVVGVIRGSTTRYGDKGARGLSAPAEKLFELFKLSGFAEKDRQEANSREEGKEVKGKRE